MVSLAAYVVNSALDDEKKKKKSPAAGAIRGGTPYSKADKNEMKSNVLGARRTSDQKRWDKEAASSKERYVAKVEAGTPGTDIHPGDSAKKRPVRGGARAIKTRPDAPPVSPISADEMASMDAVAQGGAIPATTGSPTAPPGGNAPMKQGAGIRVELSQQDRNVREGISAIDEKIAGGAIPTAEQKERIANIKRKAGFALGGTDRRPVGRDGRPIIGKDSTHKVGNMDVQFDDSVSPEARKRFLTQPSRPTSRPQRGVSRRQVSGNGPNLNRRIRPPRSIGDMIRYKREVQELKRDREHADRTARTNITGTEASARTQIGASKQAAIQQQVDIENRRTEEDRGLEATKQKKIDVLSSEYASENTTPERKLEIEREMAVQGGRQPARPTQKNLKMTEKQKADRKQKDTEFYLENRKKKGWPGSRRYETISEMMERLQMDTAPESEIPQGKTRDEVAVGEEYIREDGQRARRKS